MTTGPGSHEDTVTTDYWNHNTAYHPELLAGVPAGDSEVLDVGCGDGLLLQKLAARAGRVTGIDPDPSAISLARTRLTDIPNAQVILGDFLTVPELDGQSFDLITCVATIHHMPLGPALERMKTLLRPGGRLHIVGLAANEGVLDWSISGILVLPVRLMSRLHGESGYAGMTSARPRESLADIRRVAGALLPGSRIRRRFYYRYALTWTKPA